MNKECVELCDAIIKLFDNFENKQPLGVWFNFSIDFIKTSETEHCFMFPSLTIKEKTSA